MVRISESGRTTGFLVSIFFQSHQSNTRELGWGNNSESINLPGYETMGPYVTGTGFQRGGGGTDPRYTTQCSQFK